MDKGGLEIKKEVPGHILAKDYAKICREHGENLEANYIERIIRGHLIDQVGEAYFISVENASCPFSIPTFPSTPIGAHKETGYMIVTVRGPCDEGFCLRIQDSDDGYYEFYSDDIDEIKDAFADLQKEEVRTYDDIRALAIFFAPKIAQRKL